MATMRNWITVTG